MQVMYNVDDTTDILFDNIETGQEFSIAGNSPFSDHQLADMGVAKILATQEYKHAYHMWKSIAADNCTWVRFKSHFQEACLDREELDQTSGAAGYGSSNNVKHIVMEDSSMHLASATEARDAAFTKLTKTNGNLSTKLRQQEDQIRALQAKLCNLKVAAAT